MANILRDRRGMVLLVILAVLSLLCLIGITLVTTTRIEKEAAAATVGAAQARMVAEAAFATLLRDMVNDSTAHDGYGLDNWYSYASDGTNSMCTGGTVGTYTART